ncbi:MAG TPA: lipid-transfer protein [Acidimicrobiales bacterium]|nr:lipid-transfer protein [Acidimicrobiales bacterium]
MSGSLAPVAIAGIGQTEFSKASGRSELQLALEAITAAAADAGLPVEAIDGLVTFSIDSSDQITVARNLGLPELRFFSSSLYGGGGAVATLQLACMAVATGTARAVAVYRALNERSGNRFGRPRDAAGGGVPPAMSFSTPFGLHTPAQYVALTARRYMHVYGVDNVDLAPVTVAARHHAATNPAAYFHGRPVTVADHQASRWIVEPVLRLLDCCQESDGGVALVVTGADRARDLRQPPVRVVAAAQGAGPSPQMMTGYYHGDLTDLPDMAVVARQLWAESGLGPADVQVANLYDHFTPFVLMQLEELGFCGRGEAKDFVADGALHVGGRLPLNPHGGHLGEAYIHGLNGVTEAVRQLRGTAVNQVQGVEHVLVTAGTGLPTSGAVLGRA